MEKSKKLEDDLKQLEQTNVQLGSANLQLRQELSDKSLAFD
jgi:DNA repair exonuclease SbcCD ATPase subunit